MAVNPWVFIGATVADLVASDTFTIDEYCVGEFRLGDEVVFMANAEKWQIARKPSVKWTVADFEQIDKTSNRIAVEIWKSYWEEHFDQHPDSNVEISPCPTLPRYRSVYDSQLSNSKDSFEEPPF